MGVFATKGRARLWTGLPIGLGVNYAATQLWPSSGEALIESKPWTDPLPPRVPGLVLGLGLLIPRSTRRMGAGVLAATAAYYLYKVWYGYQHGQELTDAVAAWVGKQAVKNAEGT